MQKLKLIFLIAVLGALVAGGQHFIAGFSAKTPAATEDRSPGAAAALKGKHDLLESPYFKAPDFYNMKSGGSLVLLEKFKTRQQSTHYTCGPVAAAMVTEYFLGRLPYEEGAIAKLMDSSPITGTTIGGMKDYFKNLDWDVVSNKDTETPKDFSAFCRFVQSALAAGTPVIVENVEWGGHYRVIIGYDSMGTDYGGDDVLIMADPYDTADHVQDGYVINNAEKFFYMWFDAKLFPQWERQRPWLMARPKKEASRSPWQKASGLGK